MRNLPCVLIILDGFGIGPDGPGNAVTLAETPNLDELFATWPNTVLDASGLAVGLPEGQMGNSEVGHLNIGAGRVVYQELTRIDRAIEDGSVAQNPVLAEAIDAAIAGGSAVHLMGLVSDGGVHSHQEHLYALVEMAASRGASRVFVHAFLDGRDVPPTSGLGYAEALVMADEDLLQLPRLQHRDPGLIAVGGHHYLLARGLRLALFPFRALPSRHVPHPLDSGGRDCRVRFSAELFTPKACLNSFPKLTQVAPFSVEIIDLASHILEHLLRGSVQSHPDNPFRPRNPSQSRGHGLQRVL